MSHRTSVKDAELQEDDTLIRQLLAMDKKKDRLVRSSMHAAPADPNVLVQSWRMNEYKYNKVPCPFPTLARGLFTVWEPTDRVASDDAQGIIEAKGAKVARDGGRHRIVARGYDKFFNIGEVAWTTWSAIEKHSEPPYELTVKANGCIIFIAALTPSKLLVTSKHSLGALSDRTTSHAQKGEEWLQTHLHTAGKTTEQLAECLWNMKYTAVAELCDDSFEEHVLPYSTEKTGLHLHGINASTGAFRTLPSETIQKFARQWGFIETPFISVNTIDEVREFTDKIEKTGKWRGEPVEGFVVRCRVSHAMKTASDAPPYPPGSSFFFKVKFNEPYMMYRDWRELTKSLLSNKGAEHASRLHRNRLSRPETRMYYNWVKSEIQRNPCLFKNYNQGKGIIATRERFLQWLESDKAQETKIQALSEETNSIELKKAKGAKKTIIAPVAIPGCGKTTVAVALRILFEFGHVQSDDTKKQFIPQVKAALKTHDVVIADKNNHMRVHRKQLTELINGMREPVRLLALNWSLFDKPREAILSICADRIMERGNNHQTLIADEEDQEHENVLRVFLNQREELDENEVDTIVDLEVEEDLEDMVMRAVDACVRIIGVPKPSTEDIGLALGAARQYVPGVTDGKNLKLKRKKEKPVRYFGFTPEIDVQSLVGARVVQQDVPNSARDFWDTLLKERRVTDAPHITILHMKELPEGGELWEKSQVLFRRSKPIKFVLEFDAIVWNDRVMALAVGDVKIDENQVIDEDTKRFMELLAERDVRRSLHVTIGTRAKEINAFEARAMVRSWRSSRNAEGIQSLDMKNVVAKGEVRGLCG